VTPSGDLAHVARGRSTRGSWIKAFSDVNRAPPPSRLQGEAKDTSVP
jgi:hypothetical protein